MTGYLNGLVTFGTQGDRNRVSNYIGNWIAQWNSQHPSEAFIGSVANTTYQYPADDENHPGVNARAIQITYQCTSYQGISDAMDAIGLYVNSDAYWDIPNMSTWQV